MSDRTAQPAPSKKESTKEVLLEQLKDPDLTEREIAKIQRKLDVLRNHG